MIVGRVFDGDSNSSLIEAQYDLYSHIQGKIFQACSENLIAAANLLDADIEIVNRLKVIKGFDHRVLQDAHDIIAAYYRYAHDDFMQLPLLDEQKTVEAYKSEWIEWIDTELNTLLCVPLFVRGVVNTVIFQNGVLGHMAEEQVGSFLVGRYHMGAWAYPGSYTKYYRMDTC